MEVNILLIILAVIAVWRAWKGFHNGFAEEINRLISLVAALFVFALAIMIIYGFMEDNIKNVVIAVVVLIITGLVFHLINLIMKSLKTIAKLPIISFINGVLGIGIGLAEVIVASWIMYYIIQIIPSGSIGEQIMAWTNENEYLMMLYESNYIMKAMSGML